MYSLSNIILALISVLGFTGSMSLICGLASGNGEATTFGIVLLIIMAILIFVQISRKNEKKRALYEKALNEHIELEKTQYRMAHAEGLQKYHLMDEDDEKKYLKMVEAHRIIGNAFESSPYQEKESDWAIWGGIADALGGPAAGISTAMEIQEKNARIRADNLERKEQARLTNIRYQQKADELYKKRPKALSMKQLEEKYVAIMTWSPDTLMSFITIESKTIGIDETSGAVFVTINWSQEDRSLVIDGALRAKLYTDTGLCAGCAYLVFPKEGTNEFKGRIQGVCAEPLLAKEYFVKIEPVDLWQIALKSRYKHCETDELSIIEHRKIVYDYEKKFNIELENK